MLRKIRKLIFHPNLYFYDYFRKKLGFKKFFVTDKIRLLDSENHQKWLKVLFSHPYLYLYYKFNKRLRKPAYPILVDYRIESIEKSIMGGGKRVVLAIELERQNTIFFADPIIVLKALSKKEPNLTRVIYKFNLQGSENKIFIGSSVIFGRWFKINIIGNNNKLDIKQEVIFKSRSTINLKGDYNDLHIGQGCTFEPGSKVNIKGENNCLYAEAKVNFHHMGSLNFVGKNSLSYFCSGVAWRAPATLWEDSILLIGELTSIGATKLAWWISERKNVLIGSDCLFSWELLFRTADGHLLYDMETLKRSNNAKSIVVGDHVWVGYNTFFFKGASVGNNCMIGSRSIVTNKLPENCLCAGVPATVKRKPITWLKTFALNFDEEKIIEYDIYKKEEESDYKPIGYAKLLKIDEIDPSVSTKEKVQLIQQIINED